MAPLTFKDLEQAGWASKASGRGTGARLDG
jgi:hypothetical protein